MTTITVHKLDHQGQLQLRYVGETLAYTPPLVVLEAFFTRERMELGYVTLKPGDRFVEYFYSDRWYNIFAIYDVESRAFKGWYCNITRPARMDEANVWAEDLALDFFVQPAGREFVLDEDEFAALGLLPDEQLTARAALAELRTLARFGKLPH